MSFPRISSGRQPPSAHASSSGVSDAPGLDPPLGNDAPASGAWLLAITALGAVLRLAGLGSELWLDEIGTVLDVRQHSALELLTHFESANRHLLNSLAIGAATALAGSADWVVRLPAALCGIASVPAIYHLSRNALGRRESLLVALLLATSYHHVFFSQNARGYTGFLLGSILAMDCFVRGLAGGGRKWWWRYLGAMMLALGELPLAAFVLAAQLLVGLVHVRRRQAPRERVGPAAAALAAAALFGGLLYAPAIARAASYAATVYRASGFGQRLVSPGNLAVWIQGLTGGRRASGLLVAGLAALALAGVAAWLVYLRRQPWISWLLLGPLLLQLATVAALGLRTSPRFFLWSVPIALFHAVAISAALDARRQRRPSGRPALVVTALLVALSGALLGPYYRTPKQPTRRSLEWLAGRLEPSDVVVAVYLAKWGARYYGPGLGLEEGSDLFVVHSLPELSVLEERVGPRHLRLVTTFEPATRVEDPALFRHIEERYPVERRFRGLLADADVSLRRSGGLLSSPPAAD